MKYLKSMFAWGLLLAATHVMGYTITVDPITMEAGQSTNLIINLNNMETNLTAYQMKLFLPDGVTVQKNTNGKYAYTTNTNRHNGAFTTTVKDAADGSVLIACFSADKDVLSGTSGELIRLPLDVASTVSTSLQGCIKNIEFTDVNAQAYELDNVTFDLALTTSEQPTDDIDLSQYTLVKQFDLAGSSTTYFTIDNADQRGTAWETGNKLQQKIYNVIIPEEFSDYLALQAVYNGSGKGWWISHDKGGLYSISASRSAAVLNRKAGDLVVFESYNSDITTAMTLYNGEGEPDGPFTYNQSADATKYYVSLTGDGQVGFCGNKNGSPITRISIYEPKVKPISVKANDLTMEYGDDVPVLTWSATQDGLPVSISGEPELYTETTKDSKPGKYTIYCWQGTVSTAGVLFANGTLTITKPWVTVTAPTLTIKKGDPIPELIPTYEGFKNGWTAEQLTIQAICTTEATSDSPAGVYPITFSQNPNSGGYFNFEMVEGTLTIEEQQQPTVEVTDISQMDNVIYIEPMEAKSGEEVSVSLKMKNTAAIRGFQFDLYLPEGVTLAKNNKGKFIASLSDGRRDEGDEHTLTVSQQDDGSYRFLCGSLYEETFLGNDGEIATMTLNISENMEEGDYPVYLRNIKVSENDISKFYETAEVKSKLTINSYILGDINSDGKVDVSDYIGIANRILGNTPEGFIEKAADVDENGVIDVSDYIGVANIILTGSIYGSQHQSRIWSNGFIE